MAVQDQQSNSNNKLGWRLGGGRTSTSLQLNNYESPRKLKSSKSSCCSKGGN